MAFSQPCVQSGLAHVALRPDFALPPALVPQFVNPWIKLQCRPTWMFSFSCVGMEIVSLRCGMICWHANEICLLS